MYLYCMCGCVCVCMCVCVRVRVCVCVRARLCVPFHRTKACLRTNKTCDECWCAELKHALGLTKRACN